MADYIGDLDTPLLQLSKTDQFTLRDAVQGVHVFGGIGSGKTSGSGKALASAYLRAGMGGLVLCAKPDEVQLWLNYAKANGRANSVILFGGAGGGFNFITYELARQGSAGLGSVIECLMRIIDAARQTNPNASRSSEPFWEDATRQVLRNSVPILYAATGAVSLPDIIQFVATAPTSPTQAQDGEWQDRSFMFAALSQARRRPVRPLADSEFEKCASFWRNEFGQLDNRLRSNISMSVSTALDRFNRGRLHDAFCTRTTLVPEMTFHGAIIIMDMSALTWNEDGIVGQQLFKFCWQRAVLARNGLDQKHRDRPVFLWADESQYFVNAFDTDYQSTCRSSKACTVYLTQSLPSYVAKIGGENAKAKADMLLAGFLTKIFHNNADFETNSWASNTIGKSIQMRGNYSQGRSGGQSVGMSSGGSTQWGTNSSHGGSTDGRGGESSNWNHGSSQGGGSNWGQNIGTNSGWSTSNGANEAMDYEIEAGEFSRNLLTGGPANQGRVTGLWFQAGKRFTATQRNYLLASFKQ